MSRMHLARLLLTGLLVNAHTVWADELEPKALTALELWASMRNCCRLRR